MSTHQRTRLERWLGTPETPLEAGSGTDDVADPEPWDTVEGERPTGDMRGTFPHDPQGRSDGPTEPVRPALIERADNVTIERANDWRTSDLIRLSSTAPTLILPRNHRRTSFVITVESVVDVRIGRTEGQTIDGGRPLTSGRAYSGEHTAPVWAIGVADGAVICVDETMIGGQQWD